MVVAVREAPGGGLWLCRSIGRRLRLAAARLYEGLRPSCSRSARCLGCELLLALAGRITLLLAELSEAGGSEPNGVACASRIKLTTLFRAQSLLS